jgi:signal transduction histidine kinase
MLPATLLKRFDPGRLRAVLLVFFLALAVPTALLIWQAYGQLKWESFHQYRGMAAELTRRINTGLAQRMGAAEARGFADYSFLVASGDSSTTYRKPSALSAYPVVAELPGLIGHFQVDTDGTFSTPLLPQDVAEAESFGIAPSEFRQRQETAAELQRILGDNRLLRHRAPVTAGRVAPLTVQTTASDQTRNRAPATAIPELLEERAEDEALEEVVVAASAVESSADQAPAADSDFADYSQSVFDELKQVEQRPGEDDAAAGAKEQRTSLGKVADLRLDANLQRKSEQAEQARAAPEQQAGVVRDAPQPARAKRVQMDFATDPGAGSGRISTFASEIDPFEFSLLDSGHMVLFRNVWRNGERFIQGLLLDQESFIDAAVVRQFQGTALSQMSSVIVSYQDNVIRTAGGPSGGRYAGSAAELEGSLLYEARLSAPFDSVGLIFSVDRLPPGPGATVLGWVTLVLAVVFVGGFFAMYRVGVSQIHLARQQQDFVSAVSHELKTPLTSIRMYGEMLKDGWADSEKQQQYYEYIHDESERLTRLISNVLQLASITRNEPQLDMKPVRVATLMDQIRSKIGNQVERAEFNLQMTTDPGIAAAEIKVDSDCFAQIIINLVDNAIKFSKKSDERVIRIGAARAGDKQIVFSVRDHGPGIPKEQMKKIFKLFYRSESELTRETVGTGIGLAIVHQLATAMGGSVDVLNAQPGAEFRVFFPIRQ